MLEFGAKDIVDILIVALMLFYLYRMMRSSGTLSLFYGVLGFILIWVVASEILSMRLTGTILDKFMSIGLIVLVILFQDQIKRFLIDIGSQDKWRFISRIFRHSKDQTQDHAMALAVVYACNSMSRTKTGALIVLQQKMPLDDYEKTGDIIDADVNMRLIEKYKGSAIFFHIESGFDRGTAGCISVTRRKTVEVLQWFDPQKVPYMLIVTKPQALQNPGSRSFDYH